MCLKKLLWTAQVISPQHFWVWSMAVGVGWWAHLRAPLLEALGTLYRNALNHLGALDFRFIPNGAEQDEKRCQREVSSLLCLSFYFPFFSTMGQNVEN